MHELTIRTADGVAPPELHANRVIGNMLRYLTEQSAAIGFITKYLALKARDGGPRGQRRLERRIREAGTVMGQRIISTRLEPGKRGRYYLQYIYWSGFDPATCKEITDIDKIPEKPWICLWNCAIISKGGGYESLGFAHQPVILISHHIFSRMAQRLGLRSLPGMLLAIFNLTGAVMEFMVRHDIDLHNTESPPKGWHLLFESLQSLVDDSVPARATLVLKKHETLPAFVVATLWDHRDAA
jgi:hypothetical protein